MKDIDPLVSIIIPTYNCAQYIIESINSALKQTYRNFEIIIIDDGSTDNTKEVLKPYLDKINYIYQENSGPAAARNKGILNSTGKYIAFLDADDLWFPHKLGAQLKYFKDNPRVGLVCADAERFDNNGLLKGTKLDKADIGGLLTFEKLLYRNYIQTLTVMIKRECVEKAGLFDESKELFFVEDYDLWLRIARYYEIGYINQPLAKYRFNPHGRSGNVIRIRKSVLTLMDKMCNRYPEIECKYKHTITRMKANLFYEMGYDCFSRNEILESRKYFLTSLSLNSFNSKTWVYMFSSLLPVMFLKIIKNIKSKTQRLLCLSE